MKVRVVPGGKVWRLGGQAFLFKMIKPACGHNYEVGGIFEPVKCWQGIRAFCL